MFCRKIKIKHQYLEGKYHEMIQLISHFHNFTIYFLALKFLLFFHPLNEDFIGQCLTFCMTNRMFYHGSHFQIYFLKHYWFSYLALHSGVINQSKIIWELQAICWAILQWSLLNGQGQIWENLSQIWHEVHLLLQSEKFLLYFCWIFLCLPYIICYYLYL